MPKNVIVLAEYENTELSFTEDGWFNATLAAEKYGRQPNEWLRLSVTQEYLSALARKYGEIPHYKTKRGKNGGTWLHPKLAVRFAQWLDIDFSIWCDEQIDSLLRGTHEVHDWQKMRHAAASSYKVMSSVLQLGRNAIGKSTEVKHYTNEARMVNWALTGKFQKLDRENLTAHELDLLAKFEEQNAVFLGLGIPYQERKKALHNFAQEQQLMLGQAA